MTERGFYVVSDKFFDDFPDPYLKGNKNELRPHYYCFIDKINIILQLYKDEEVKLISTYLADPNSEDGLEARNQVIENKLKYIHL